jgi:hypothetical protein
MVSPPVALALTLCDYIIMEEKSRKISLIGTFTRLAVDRFLGAPAPFCIFSVLTDGLGDGTMELVLTRLDTGEELYAYRVPVHFHHKLAEVRCPIRVRKCLFPAAGHYLFTLLVDREWVAQRHFEVYMSEGES